MQYILVLILGLLIRPYLLLILAPFALFGILEWGITNDRTNYREVWFLLKMEFRLIFVFSGLATFILFLSSEDWLSLKNKIDKFIPLEEIFIFYLTISLIALILSYFKRNILSQYRQSRALNVFILESFNAVSGVARTISGIFISWALIAAILEKFSQDSIRILFFALLVSSAFCYFSLMFAVTSNEIQRSNLPNPALNPDC